MAARLGESSASEPLDLRWLEAVDHRWLLADRAAHAHPLLAVLDVADDEEDGAGSLALARVPELADVVGLRTTPGGRQCDLERVIAGAQEQCGGNDRPRRALRRPPGA